MEVDIIKTAKKGEGVGGSALLIYIYFCVCQTHAGPMWNFSMVIRVNIYLMLTSF